MTDLEQELLDVCKQLLNAIPIAKEMGVYETKDIYRSIQRRKTTWLDWVQEKANILIASIEE